MSIYDQRYGGAGSSQYMGFGVPIQSNPYMSYGGGGYYSGMPSSSGAYTGRPDGATGAGSPGYNNEADRPAPGANQGQADTAESTALSYLTGVVGGTNTPFDQNTQNNMYSQASNMNAAAEGAQNQAIMGAAARGGAGANDPSAQLAQRQNMAQRQGANQNAMGQIQSQANIANQRTQQQAANSLLGHADERYAIQNGNNQRLSQLAMGFLGGGGGSNTQGNSTGGMLNIGQEPHNQGRTNPYSF